MVKNRGGSKRSYMLPNFFDLAMELRRRHLYLLQGGYRQDQKMTLRAIAKRLGVGVSVVV
jgi:hypothetical protein